ETLLVQRSGFGSLSDGTLASTELNNIALAKNSNSNSHFPTISVSVCTSHWPCGFPARLIRFRSGKPTCIEFGPNQFQINMTVKAESLAIFTSVLSRHLHRVPTKKSKRTKGGEQS